MGRQQKLVLKIVQRQNRNIIEIKGNKKANKKRMVKSELQLAVLHFCRDCWKYVYKLQEPARSQMSTYVRQEFQKYKDLPRMRFHQIEYRLRNGKNRLAMIQQAGKIDGINFR